MLNNTVKAVVDNRFFCKLMVSVYGIMQVASGGAERDMVDNGGRAAAGCCNGAGVKVIDGAVLRRLLQLKMCMRINQPRHDITAGNFIHGIKIDGIKMPDSGYLAAGYCNIRLKCIIFGYERTARYQCLFHNSSLSMDSSKSPVRFLELPLCNFSYTKNADQTYDDPIGIFVFNF